MGFFYYPWGTVNPRFLLYGYSLVWMRYPKHIIVDLSKMKTSNVLGWRRQVVLTIKSPFLRPMRQDLPTPLLTSRIWGTSNYSNQPQVYLFSSQRFDVNFIRKEKLYTKLKYSRCPQYDIVSGGFAAILAGFIGFLISEKFGIELVDSGDFYTAFMYGVIIVFSVRPLIRIYSKDAYTYTPISLNYLLIFSHDLGVLLIQEIKSTIKFVKDIL